MSISGGADYTEGSVIECATFGDYKRQVKVQEAGPVKHGRPGFSGHVTDGPEEGLAVWGYDSQVTKVISR